MTLQPGSKIWIPCEVKPGPFSDERFVRASVNGTDWLGFVQARHLKEPIFEGSTQVPGMVVSVLGDRFTAQVQGEALNPVLLEGFVSQALYCGS